MRGQLLQVQQLALKGQNRSKHACHLVFMQLSDVCQENMQLAAHDEHQGNMPAVHSGKLIWVCEYLRCELKHRLLGACC